MVLAFLRGRSSEGTKWASTFRALVLRQKVIATATGTGAKLTGYLRVAMWAGAGHSGNLITALRTFDNAHNI